MEIQKGIEEAIEGEGILFVGAGFSRGAVNLRGEPLKSGREFAAHLAVESGSDEDSSLEDAAEAYIENFGEDALINEIKAEYSVSSVQQYHREIATIPWKRIYTTNYDNVVETAFRLERKQLTPITLDADMFKTPKRQTLCIHFNGYVDSINRDKIWNELKLTDSSYVTASIADTAWGMLFRQDIRLARVVFFVGYSLFDLDVKRMLSQSDLLKNKCFFYVGTSPKKASKDRASRFGTVIMDSTQEFATILNMVKASHLPRSDKTLSLMSVREYFTPDSGMAITDKSFFDLLVYGTRNDELIRESIQTGKTFYLERGLVRELFERVSNGHRVFAVCSDLGNGKSLILEGLRMLAIERGYRVFDLCEHNDGVHEELETIAKIDGKVLLIVEEYQHWLDEIRVFTTNATDQTVLVATARNAIHDVVFDDFVSSTGSQDVCEINVDTLTDHEIEWIANALDEYGLWGAMAGIPQWQKHRFLSNKCRKQFHAILLKLFDAPHIERRLSSITEKLRKSGDDYKVFLSILILTLLNHTPTLDMLTDIWGTNVTGKPSFRKDPLIKEFVSFDYYSMLVRSPIAAEYLLKKSVDVGTLIPVLIKMIEQVNKGARNNRSYYDIFKSLTMFSNLQLLLPERGFRSAVIRYYESIKNLPNCKQNYHFWLQYAIATLVIKELSQSEKYFETAYSLARQGNKDTYKIDNHYARFLMVQGTEQEDCSKAMENFRNTRSIITRQIQDDRRHYPYSVATLYKDLIDIFGKHLNQPEIQEVERASTHVLDRIINLPENRRRHSRVRICQDNLQYVVKRCGQLTLRVKK
ncbi:MAG: SIR2 family protein [Desulfomonilaceae bacterium]